MTIDTLNAPNLHDIARANVFHRKAVMRAVINPPIPLSTFDEWVETGKVPPPDGFAGRNPLWSTASYERFKQSFIDAARPHRKRAVK